MMHNLLAEAHRDLADVDTKAEEAIEENKRRTKHKIVAKMLKGTLSMAFETWRQKTVEHNKGVKTKLTPTELRAWRDVMLDEFRDLVSVMSQRDGEWFNDDTHYKDAMTQSLDTKKGIINKYSELRSERWQKWTPEVGQRILKATDNTYTPNPKPQSPNPTFDHLNPKP